MNETPENNCTHEPRRHRRGLRALVVTIALVAGIGATLTIAAKTHGGPWGQGDRLAFMVDRMTDRLDLNQEQQTQIEAILTASKAAAEPYRDELQTLRADMRELVAADAFYEEQVRIKLETKAAAMVELGVIATRTMHDVRAALTPEQRAEADALMKKFGERGGRRGHWRHTHDQDDA